SDCGPRHFWTPSPTPRRCRRTSWIRFWRALPAFDKRGTACSRGTRFHRKDARMSEPLLLVEPRGHAGRQFAHLEAKRLRTASEIQDALARNGRGALWVAASAVALQLLLSALAGRSRGDQRLLALARGAGARHRVLHAIFRSVVSADDGVRLLRTDELANVLGAPNRDELFIGIAGAPGDAAVVVYRGNLEPIVAP